MPIQTPEKNSLSQALNRSEGVAASYINIGPYIFCQRDIVPKEIWLENADGERMRLSENDEVALIGYITAFWRERF